MSGMRTMATRQQDHWALHSSKSWGELSAGADLCTVLQSGAHRDDVQEVGCFQGLPSKEL